MLLTYRREAHTFSSLTNFKTISKKSESKRRISANVTPQIKREKQVHDPENRVIRFSLHCCGTRNTGFQKCSVRPLPSNQRINLTANESKVKSVLLWLTNPFPTFKVKRSDMIHMRKLSNIGRRCSNLHANSISSFALLRPSLTPPSQGNNKYQLVSRKRISTDTIVADALVSDAVAPQLGWSLSHIAMYTVDQVISFIPSPFFRLIFLNTSFKPFYRSICSHMYHTGRLSSLPLSVFE